MDKPIIGTFNTLQPILTQLYERYLPTAFDDSLTMLEKINKVIQYLNEIGELTNDVVEQWNEVMEWAMNDGLTEAVNDKIDSLLQSGAFDKIFDTGILTTIQTQVDKNTNNITDLQTQVKALDDSTANLSTLQDEVDKNKSDISNLSSNVSTNTTNIQTNTTDITNIKNITKSFTHVASQTTPDTSVSVATNDSLYIPNDANIFGYKADGTHLNIGTVQQNDIVQYGDPNVDNLWVESGGYLSIRSAYNPSYQKISSDNLGTPIESGRTLFHVGNMCNHALSSVSSGTQLMTQNTFNYINIADINGQFPIGNFNGTDYTIPRSGLYLFDFTVRPSSLANQFSVCRIGHTIDRTGTPTNYNMKDILMSSAYGTGFYGNTYMKEFAAGDVISPFIYPLTEDIIIQAGTKVNIYFLGDKPTS